MRPILAIMLAVCLGFLIYSQREAFWGTVAENVNRYKNNGEDTTGSGSAMLIVEPMRDPAQADIRLRDAERAYDEDDFDAAETALKKALAFNPDIIEGRMLLGVVLSHKRRYEDAREQFLQAFQLDTTSTAPLMHLISIASLLGQKADAMGYLEKAERLNPDNPKLAGWRSVLEKGTATDVDTLLLPTLSVDDTIGTDVLPSAEGSR